MRRYYQGLLYLSTIAAPTLAFAGAWTQAQGNLHLITTASFYHQYELNPYVEYGLRDDITIGGSVELQHLHQSTFGVPGNSDWGVGDSEFFVRKRLWNEGGFVASLEPMVKLPSMESSALNPRIGNQNYDAGLGGSLGYGFSALGLHHFADIDTQYRHRFGNRNDQLRVSATLGLAMTPRWMLMPQAFLTYRAGVNGQSVFTQSSSDDYNLTRLQLSAVYDVSDKVRVQFGGFADVDGKNTGMGKGLLVALWTHL